MDQAKVALNPPARWMIQQKMRLALLLAMGCHPAPHLIVLAAVAMLIPQPLEHAHGRVLLLARSQGILGQDLLEDRNELAQLGAHRRPAARVRPRRSLNQRLLDRVAAVTQPLGDLPD